MQTTVGQQQQNGVNTSSTNFVAPFEIRTLDNSVLTKRMLSCIIPVKKEDFEKVVTSIREASRRENFNFEESKENRMARIFFNELNFGVLAYNNPDEINLAIYISEKTQNEDFGSLLLNWLNKVGYPINYIPERREFVMAAHFGDPVHELKWLEKFYVDVVTPHLMFTDDFTTLGGADIVSFFIKSAKPYLFNLRHIVRKDEKDVFHFMIEFVCGVRPQETKAELKEIIGDAGRVLEEKVIDYYQRLKKAYNN